MSEPLTLAEAVPLGTVHLQRLLADAGVRSLAIKGPAFVELGVREQRQSHDIDLLIHPDDRVLANEALAAARWSTISHWFPPALDDIIYSTTLRHPQFPVTLDLHHRFSGLLADPAVVFERMWQRRADVALANHRVVTLCREQAFVVEALNAIKLIVAHQRGASVKRVALLVDEGEVRPVIAAAEEVGARHTARELIRELGGPEPSGPPPPGHDRWMSRGALVGGKALFGELVRRAPQHIPRVLWQQLTLDPSIARFWASTHDVTYRSPQQILWLRIRRALRR